jgi:HB1, ASXL, restriction endonuclease HTH domain
MTFLEAAEVVLRTARKPLTVREITETALRRGLLETHGKTPEATMSAALYGGPPDGPIRVAAHYCACRALGRPRAFTHSGSSHGVSVIRALESAVGLDRAHSGGGRELVRKPG